MRDSPPRGRGEDKPGAFLLDNDRSLCSTPLTTPLEVGRQRVDEDQPCPRELWRRLRSRLRLSREMTDRHGVFLFRFATEKEGKKCIKAA